MKQQVIKIGLIAAAVLGLAGAGIGIVAAQSDEQTSTPAATDEATPDAADDVSSPDATNEPDTTAEPDSTQEPDVADDGDKSGKDAAEDGEGRDGRNCDKNGNGIPDSEESGGETDETSSLTF
jgi:hypothetical protein